MMEIIALLMQSTTKHVEAVVSDNSLYVDIDGVILKFDNFDETDDKQCERIVEESYDFFISRLIEEENADRASHKKRQNQEKNFSTK